MKSARKQQRRKCNYLGTSSAITYTGSKTQPGHVGNRAGTKLARKANDNRSSRAFRGGIVSRSYENIQKSRVAS